jgi:hypothetical protein
MTHQIDVTRGSTIGDVSAQWFSRPDDQKYLDLSSLRADVARFRDESSAFTVTPREIVARAEGNALTFDVAGRIVEPTNFGFGQMARVISAPAQYLRRLPAPLAAQCVNEGLQQAEEKPISTYIRQNGSTTLRAVTSTSYGRIFDVDVVDAVMGIAGNGTGDERWKVPGCIDWSSKHGISYNPNVTITKENTTLYASDRDVFLFLVDDLNPIEVGKLNNGEPDLMFRGFYVWNSEVGSRTFGIATMYLRGVCQNRNLWGVEGFQKVVLKHKRLAPQRFIEQAGPALLQYANADTSRLVAGVSAAKRLRLALDDDERIDTLTGMGFGLKVSKEIIETGEMEEGTRPETVWDFAQAISAYARLQTYADARVEIEQIAGKLLDKVAVA